MSFWMVGKKHLQNNFPMLIVIVCKNNLIVSSEKGSKRTMSKFTPEDIASSCLAVTASDLPAIKK
jgi:hypothetical protein